MKKQLAEISRLQALIASLKSTLAARPSLYKVAVAALGTDASPLDRANDEVGCAETASELIHKVLPGFPIITGTYTLWRTLEADRRFRKVSLPMPGAIVISPTGMGNKNIVSNGHVGICGTGDLIMSNSSASGKFMQNYTQATWRGRYGAAGYPIYYYQLI